MKTKENQMTEPKKASSLNNLKTLSKTQLETIIGGPDTSRGTTTQVGD